MGNVGPFDRPEAAVKATISTLYRVLAGQQAAATALSAELATLRTTLDQADHGDGLAPWRRAFDPAEGGQEAV